MLALTLTLMRHGQSRRPCILTPALNLALTLTHTLVLVLVLVLVMVMVLILGEACCF